MRLRVPRPEDFRSPAPSPAVAARLGLWLGVAFALCFLTGVASHYAQHPPGWLAWPTRPVSLYRISQGVHVLSGIAAIPLLLAKAWSVYPRLFIRPPRRPPAEVVSHAIERLSILVQGAAVVRFCWVRLRKKAWARERVAVIAGRSTSSTVR
jgi:hypothetical protein